MQPDLLWSHHLLYGNKTTRRSSNEYLRVALLYEIYWIYTLLLLLALLFEVLLLRQSEMMQMYLSQLWQLFHCKLLNLQSKQLQYDKLWINSNKLSCLYNNLFNYQQKKDIFVRINLIQKDLKNMCFMYWHYVFYML